MWKPNLNWQGGKSYYGAVRLIPTDAVEGGVVRIKSRKVRKTFEMEDFPTDVIEYETHTYANLSIQFNLKKWRKKYTKCGYEEWKNSAGGPAAIVAHWDKGGIFIEDVSNVTETFHVLVYNVRSPCDAADAANYFGDRLRPSFYEDMKDLIIKAK